ncbi:hypothetical protein DFQ27_004922 [Actinomortierella ambigua]|uniref:F-box domain-containing protein n=1 Tax=Actinomortierella ambigua TaxID=1343610 RepID=A0A9P6Q0G9_9FUNG|nr:hypothetical protein DFQ27_004922 [Actinomortierella ambigua]
MSHSASPANGHPVPAAVMHLLPEIAHHVRAHLTTHQLASAARVCRAWYSIWTPYLWENVHHNVPSYRNFPPLGKHASYVRSFEGRFLTGGYPTKDELYRQSRAAVNRRGKGGVGGGGGIGGPGVLGGEGGSVGGGRSNLNHTTSLTTTTTTTTTTCSTSSSSSSSSSTLPPILMQLDILRLEGTHLQELSLFKTDIELDRLDQLLASLSQLQVFRFEVLNRVGPDYTPRSVETRPVGTGVAGSYKSLGLLWQCEERLLGVVATRLSRQLQRLELTFDAKAQLHVAWVLFLIATLQGSLRALKLENFSLAGSVNGGDDWKALGIEKFVDHLCSLRRGDDATFGSSSSLFGSTLESPLEPTVASLTHSIGQLTTARTMTTTSNMNIDNNSNDKTTAAPTAWTGLTSLTLIRQHWTRDGGPHCLARVLHACPNLEELNIHDSEIPNDAIVTAILDHNPKLTRLAFSKMPYMTSRALERLFQGRRWAEGPGGGNPNNNPGATSLSPSALPVSSSSSSLFSSSTASFSASLSSLSPFFSSSSTLASTSFSSKDETTTDAIMVPQLENVRLGYLHFSLTDPLKALAQQHGKRLRCLSIHWCPTVTTQDVWPVLKKCARLEELALQLTKVSTKIFEDIPQEMVMTEPGGGGVAVLEPKMETWACAATLRKLDIGGPMFVDYSRYRERFLRPTVYHHLSPNPYLIGTSSNSAFSSTTTSSGSSSSGNTQSGGSGSSTGGNSNSSSSNFVHDYDGSGTPPMSPSTSGPSGPSTPSPSTAPSSPPPSPMHSHNSTTTTTTAGTGVAVVGGHTFNSSIVRIAAMFNNFVPPPNQHPHVERHWTDESLNPLYRMQTRLAGFPRLRELGLQTKGVEQWILKGFNHHQDDLESDGSNSGGGGGGNVVVGGGHPFHRRYRSSSSGSSRAGRGGDSLSSTGGNNGSGNDSQNKDNINHKNSNNKYEIKIQTLTLMNQQGRILDRSRVLELIASYPYLRRLVCDRSTIFHHRLTPAEKEDLERTFANCDIEVVQI